MSECQNRRLSSHIRYVPGFKSVPILFEQPQFRVPMQALRYACMESVPLTDLYTLFQMSWTAGSQLASPADEWCV